jgi:ABC-type dipeptide/oligopeptide/nickel transport system permease component
MVTYVFKRLVQMIPLIIIISMIAFGIIRIAEKFAKADPIAALRMNPTTTEATIQREIKLDWDSMSLFIRDIGIGPLDLRWEIWEIHITSKHL